MLTEKQIEEIKEHLEKAQNPIFYYDNDADGLCSYLLLRRYLGRGKGVVVRSFPELNKDYARKAQQLGSDYVFILDKPVRFSPTPGAYQLNQIPRFAQSNIKRIHY